MSRFLHICESADDLVLQSQMQRELGRRTGTCFQRCVGQDASNAMWSTTYDIDQKPLGGEKASERPFKAFCVLFERHFKYVKHPFKAFLGMGRRTTSASWTS